MKDFKNFRTYFTENHSRDMAEKSAEIMRTQMLKHSDGKKQLNMDELAIATSASLAFLSTTMIFDILEKYHNWLDSDE